MAFFTRNIGIGNIYLSRIVIVKVFERCKPPSSVKVVHEQVPELEKLIVRSDCECVNALEDFHVIGNFDDILVEFVGG